MDGDSSAFDCLFMPQMNKAWPMTSATPPLLQWILLQRRGLPKPEGAEAGMQEQDGAPNA
jgi:hypothetical protein